MNVSLPWAGMMLLSLDCSSLNAPLTENMNKSSVTPRLGIVGAVTARVMLILIRKFVGNLTAPIYQVSNEPASQTVALGLELDSLSRGTGRRPEHGAKCILV